MNLYHHIPERTFTAQIIKQAQWRGWICAHFRTAQTKRGNYVTAVQGDGAGFFDLVLIRRERLILAELKSAKGKLSKKQEVWFEAAKKVPIEVYLWRPEDIENIEKILT